MRSHVWSTPPPAGPKPITVSLPGPLSVSKIPMPPPLVTVPITSDQVVSRIPLPTESDSNPDPGYPPGKCGKVVNDFAHVFAFYLLDYPRTYLKFLVGCPSFLRREMCCIYVRLLSFVLSVHALSLFLLVCFPSLFPPVYLLPVVLFYRLSRAGR